MQTINRDLLLAKFHAYGMYILDINALKLMVNIAAEKSYSLVSPKAQF